MAGPLATVFLSEVVTPTFSWAEKYSQLRVNFSGGLLPSPQVLPSWELFTRKVQFLVLNQDSHLSLGSAQWRVHPAVSTGILWSWNITILYSQIKVSSISLLHGVKLDLLTSWMQQPGVEMVMTASVRGSIQLGIFFFLLFGKRGSQDECLANFWNMYLYKRTIKAE